MEVVAGLVRGPLVADQGSEPAGFVVALGRAGVGLPDRLGQPGIEHRLRRRASPDRSDDLERGIHTLAACHHVVPALQCRIGHQERIAILQFYRRAQSLGMIGDDQKIERPAQLHPLAG